MGRRARPVRYRSEDLGMKAWEKFFELFKPFEPAEEISEEIKKLLRENYEEGLRIGFEVGIGYLSDDIIDKLEEPLAATKMKKKYRKGYMDAVNGVYLVLNEYSEYADRGVMPPMQPYWTATNSWRTDAGSTTEEWDSFE